MQSSHDSPLHGDSLFFLVVRMSFLSDIWAHTWVEFLSLPCTQSLLLHTEEHPTERVQLQFKSIQNWHATPAAQSDDASLSWARTARAMLRLSVKRIMRATIITNDKGCLIVMMVNYCIWATHVQYRTCIAAACDEEDVVAFVWHICVR
jgi:hypothetical protein